MLEAAPPGRMPGSTVRPEARRYGRSALRFCIWAVFSFALHKWYLRSKKNGYIFRLILAWSRGAFYEQEGAFPAYFGSKEW